MHARRTCPEGRRTESVSVQSDQLRAPTVPGLAAAAAVARLHCKVRRVDCRIMRVVKLIDDNLVCDEENGPERSHRAFQVNFDDSGHSNN